MCTKVYYGVRATWKNKIANKKEMCFFLTLRTHLPLKITMCITYTIF